MYAGARLLALADGMGGHAAGEVASQLVIAALAHLDDDEPGGDLLGKLDQAVRDGNHAIAEHVEVDPELEGMGTTLTAILFAGNRLGLVHVGDSRGYLLRDGELNQITKDDTFVQTLVDEGRITAEEAHSHPQRSLIMRALTGHDVDPTLTVREARAGDRYLLCSDGLSDPVSQDTILDALKIPDVVESADRLIELALRGGGPDNVTVVVADVVDYDYGQTEPILAGAVSGNDDHPAPPNTAAGRASAINPRRDVAKKVLPPPPEPPPSRKPRWRRIVIVAVLLVLLLVAGLAIARTIVRGNYYLTATSDGTVTIMQGVPGSLPGYTLQEPHLYGCVNDRDMLSLVDPGQKAENCQPLKVTDLRPDVQKPIVDGLPTGTLDDAIARIRDLVPAKLLPVCAAPQKAPTPPIGPAPRETVTPRTTEGQVPSEVPPQSTDSEAPITVTTTRQTAGPPLPGATTTTTSPPRGPLPGPAPTDTTGPPTTPSTTVSAPTTAITPTEAPPTQQPGVNCRKAG